MVMVFGINNCVSIINWEDVTRSQWDNFDDADVDDDDDYDVNDDDGDDNDDDIDDDVTVSQWDWQDQFSHQAAIDIQPSRPCTRWSPSSLCSQSYS